MILWTKKETMTKFGNSEFADKKSIEEKGANFLYLIVKNHVFAEFLWNII